MSDNTIEATRFGKVVNLRGEYIAIRKDDWNHLCDHINWRDSCLDARSIRTINEVTNLKCYPICEEESISVPYNYTTDDLLIYARETLCKGMFYSYNLNRHGIFVDVVIDGIRTFGWAYDYKIYTTRTSSKSCYYVYTFDKVVVKKSSIRYARERGKDI